MHDQAQEAEAPRDPEHMPVSASEDGERPAGMAIDLDTDTNTDVRHADPPETAAVDTGDDGRAARILRARARRLAEAPRPDDTGDSVDVLVFRLRDEQYAIRAALLRMVHRGEGLTPVPCTPPFVAGILNVRGEILTVLDLAVALGLQGAPDQDDLSSILLADCAGQRVGLLVDEVLGMRPLALDTLAPPLSTDNFALGVSEARIVYLDLEQLLVSGRFDVLEDVS